MCRIGVSPSRPSTTSPATPTIVCHGACDAGMPHFTRLPIGSCPGQNRSARARLTTATSLFSASSSGRKARPLTMGTPNVRK
jgi:hypothetical protein